jgi:hypothetical protein
MPQADPTKPHSISELASGLAGDVQDLVRGELALARAEFDSKLHTILISAVSIVGGALVAFAGLVVFLQGGAAVLALWMPVWGALLIIGVVIVIVGGLIARGALAKLSLKTLTPDHTIASVQKDARMIKGHI